MFDGGYVVKRVDRDFVGRDRSIGSDVRRCGISDNFAIVHGSSCLDAIGALVDALVRNFTGDFGRKCSCYIERNLLCLVVRRVVPVPVLVLVLVRDRLT